MKIELKSLTLENFKGIRKLHADFGEQTTIAGANATGKSTVQDAFTWLLFGKNANDKKDFNVKNTIEKDLNRSDHSVTAVLEVDNQPIKLQRIFREKHTKRRGSEETEFTGHETTFLVDDVPCNQTEFNARIDGLISEDKFKLLTNIRHFNETLSWQQRRAMLLSLAGEISHKEVAGNDKSLLGVVEMMEQQNKSLEMLRKQYAAERKAIKKELDAIPARIDEASRVATTGAILTDIEVNDLKQKLADMDEMIGNISAAYNQQKKAIEEHKKKAMEIERSIMEREEWLRKSYNSEYKRLTEAIDTARREFNVAQSLKQAAIESIDNLHKQAEQKNNQRDELRGRWFTENEKVFTPGENDLNCPACKQPLPDGARAQEELFKLNKAKVLNDISKQGNELKAWIETMYKESLTNATEAMEDAKRASQAANARIGELSVERDALTPVKELYENDQDIKALTKSLDVIEQEVLTVPKSQEIAELEQNRDGFKAQLQAHESAVKQHESKDKRIEELVAQEKELAKQMAGKEKMEDAFDRFSKTLVQVMEQRVAGLFGHGISFRLFKEQINGGLDDTCETLIDGVPYSDANNAGRINAGVNIINTFSKEMDISAPVWVDNAEALNQVAATDCQLVLLKVTEDKELKIETN